MKEIGIVTDNVEYIAVRGNFGTTLWIVPKVVIPDWFLRNLLGGSCLLYITHKVSEE